MKIFGICLGVTLFGIVVGFAEEKSNTSGKQVEKDAPKMIRVQVEYIEVAHETMTELLSESRTSADDTPLRAKLQGLVKEGKAKVIETQLVTARSGQKAMTESVHEFIYPIEYDAPEIPHTRGDQASPTPKGPFTPVAWETRNLGSTLEIEPNIDVDGKAINLRLFPRLVYHTGNKVWHEETVGKDIFKIQMPDIYEIQADTAVTLITGQPFMMAAVSPKDEKGEADFTKKVLIFVRADVLMGGP